MILIKNRTTYEKKSCGNESNLFELSRTCLDNKVIKVSENTPDKFSRAALWTTLISMAGENGLSRASMAAT